MTNDVESWGDVSWHPPRLVGGKIVDNECVVHFMYRMPLVPCHATKTLVEADRENAYLADAMLGHRDRLLQEHEFDMKTYVRDGPRFMGFRGETAGERVEVGIRLFEMFTPIYEGLKKLGCSNEDLFG